MENEAQNQQSNNEKKEEWPSEKTYDVFISYRRASSTEDDQRHSTSLARSIALELVSEGFTVYFDCWDGDKEYLKNIEKSKYFFILLTSYSWEKEGGESFKQEIDKIEKGIEEGRISKSNVWWIDIDKSASKVANIVSKEIEKAKKELKEAQEKLKEAKASEEEVKKAEEKLKKIQEDSRYSAYIEFKKLLDKYIINDISTKKDSLIKDFIDEPKNGNGKVIRKDNRLSFKALKTSYENDHKKLEAIHESTKRLKRTYMYVRTILFCLLLGAIIALIVMLIQNEQYRKDCIIFAGGGTVREYLKSSEKYNKIDVSNYSKKINSKYIHIPSTSAWDLLWDDLNDNQTRLYCPIILSTGKINTGSTNLKKYEDKDKRIAEYKLDSIPLMVQVYDANNDISKEDSLKGTISLKALKALMIKAKKNDNKYVIWTTTEKSGTYLEYKALLNDTSIFLDLDSIVNHQDEKRCDFSYGSPIREEKKTTIILANNRYFYKTEENFKQPTELILVSNENEQLTIPLYVYTIAEKTKSKEYKKDVLKLLPEAAQFLDIIGCDTINKEFIKNDIIVPWYPK